MSREDLVKSAFKMENNHMDDSFSLEIQELVLGILERARRNANFIKERAKTEGYHEGLEEGRRDGYREGYENGYKRGYEEGINFFKDKIEYLEKLGEEVLLERHRLFEEYKYEIVQMALEIARKLVFTELLTNPDIIYNIISKAISLMKEKESIKIVVNPVIFGLIDGNNLLTIGGNKVEIVSDQRLDEGDVIIITPGEQVEFRLKERLKELEESFRDVFTNLSRPQ
ncbi:MAG: FliH/SctL family protein [bacterium]|nr:FliH/SctL family protein [bacterium]